MRDKWERADYRTSTIKKALEGLTATWQPPETRQAYGTTEREAARRWLDSEAAENFRINRKTKTASVMRFDGAVWIEDSHGHGLMRSVGEVAKVIVGEMANAPNTAHRDSLYSLAKKLESARGLIDVCKLVKSDLPDFVPENSDSHNDLLCVKNGIIHLGSGILTPHYAGWQFTRMSPVRYDKEAKCPLWLKFLDEFCCGDKELARFLQVYSGYCASGYTTEHKMAVLFGGGLNGKSVFLNTLGYVLGGFAGVTPADTLLHRKSEQSNDLAALEGVRFVQASESDEGQALAEGRLKAITGGDKIVCRKLFEEYGSYTPHFKLNLATNSKPRVSGTDNGVWRRLILIHCNASIKHPDKTLSEKLKMESSGILSWMLEGFRLWRREGLVIPDCIKAATNEYRKDSDQVGRFLDDICTPWRGQSTQSSEVYKAYAAWCAEQGHHPYAQNRFSQKMAEKGYAVEKKHNGRYFPAILGVRTP